MNKDQLETYASEIADIVMVLKLAQNTCDNLNREVNDKHSYNERIRAMEMYIMGSERTIDVMYDILGDMIFKLDKIVGDFYEFEADENNDNIKLTN